MTDTPRTDAAIELYGERPLMTPAVPVEFAQQLEQELNASQAEVERLRANLRRAIKIAEGMWASKSPLRKTRNQKQKTK